MFVSAPPRPHSHRPAACLLALVGLALLFALAACGKTEAASGQSSAGPVPITVDALPALAKPDLQRYVRVVGSLAAYEKAALSNRVTGTVEKIYVDMGDVVKPGQKLADIDPARYRMALDQAQQALQETLSRLGLKEIPTDAAFDVDSTSPVKKALADLSAAQNKYDRAESLYKQKLINDYEWLDTQAAFRVAQTNVQATRDDTRAVIAAARQARAIIELRQQDLDDTVISAPSGQIPNGDTVDRYRVAERRVSVGEYLREGSPLFTLVADGKLKLQARVPEGELARVSLGQLVTFHVEAYGNRTFSGKITALAPTIEPTNRTFMVEATVDNAAGLLHADSFVQGRILTEKQPVIMVPIDAITSFAGVTKLFIADPAPGGALSARQVEVTPGQQDGQLVEIPAGVKPGELIVTTGQTKLVSGSPLQLRRPTTATTEKAAEPTAHP